MSDAITAMIDGMVAAKTNELRVSISLLEADKRELQQQNAALTEDAVSNQQQIKRLRSVCDAQVTEICALKIAKTTETPPGFADENKKLRTELFISKHQNEIEMKGFRRLVSVVTKQVKLIEKEHKDFEQSIASGNVDLLVASYSDDK